MNFDTICTQLNYLFLNYTGCDFCIFQMVAPVPDWDCVWSYLWPLYVYFRVFILRCKVCVSSEETVLLCWHMNTIPPWWEQKKGLAAGFKKSRHAWQQQYKHSSYHTCSSGPVWCDKNHHIGWEAWQTVGRHAQAQHNSIAITSPGTLCTMNVLCTMNWKEAAPAPYKTVSKAQM